MSLHDHIDQLRMIRDQLSRLSERARACADSFNGSEGKGVATDRDPSTSAPYLNNQFADNIIAIQGFAGALTDQINRIEQQVIGDTGRGSSGIAAQSTLSDRLKGMSDERVSRF